MLNVDRLLQLPAEKPLDPIEDEQRTKELRFSPLGAALGGLLLALLVVVLGPFLVGLDPSRIRFPDSPGAWLIFALLTALPPTAAFIAARRSRQSSALAKVRIRDKQLVITALLALLAAGWAFEQRPIQWYFLEAVKVRAEKFSLPRSVAYWKSDLLQSAAGDNQPGISLVGSSQLNLAIDADELQRANPGLQIWKNTLPGFGILQYLMILPVLRDQAPMQVIGMLSEFDVFRDDRIPVDRLRYFGGVREKAGLASLLSPPMAWANRSELVDLLMANVSPFWRDRDLVSVVAFDMWWRSQKEGQIEDSDEEVRRRIEEHTAVLARSIGHTPMVEVNFAAFELFAAELSARGVDLVVFEGKSNPLASSVYDPGGSLGTTARNRFELMAADTGFKFVSTDRQPVFGEKDFADAVHLNARAREQFTEFVNRQLCFTDCSPSMPVLEP